MQRHKRSRGTTAKRFFISFNDSTSKGKHQRTQLNPPIPRLLNTIPLSVAHNEEDCSEDLSTIHYASSESSQQSFTASENLSELSDEEEPVSYCVNDPELPMERINEYIADLRHEQIPIINEHHFAANRNETEQPKSPSTNPRSNAQRDNWLRILPEFIKTHIEIRYNMDKICSNDQCRDEGVWRCMDCDTGSLLYCLLGICLTSDRRTSTMVLKTFSKKT